MIRAMNTASFMRETVMTLILVLFMLCAAHASEVPCCTGDECALEGIRLVLAAPVEQLEFQADEATFVAHGWWQWPACFEGRSNEWICDYIDTHVLFELRVNGVLVPPDHVVIEWAPYTHPEIVQEAWRVRWVYVFPAHTFDPGVYVFEGTWVHLYPEDPLCRSEDHPEETLQGTRSVTVSVLWPDDSPE